MSIQLEVQRLENAKSDIASAIGEKGVTVPQSASLSTYGDYVRQIQTGGLSSFTFEDCTLAEFIADAPITSDPPVFYGVLYARFQYYQYVDEAFIIPVYSGTGSGISTWFNGIVRETVNHPTEIGSTPNIEAQYRSGKGTTINYTDNYQYWAGAIISNDGTYTVNSDFEVDIKSYKFTGSFA